MLHADEWGQDPGISRMRQTFTAMEEGQRELLKRAGLPPFDPRLRKWRERALALFEDAWVGGGQTGQQGGAGEVYVHCLEEVLAADGVRAQRLPSPAGSEPQ